jgi:hypothetical protein
VWITYQVASWWLPSAASSAAKVLALGSEGLTPVIVAVLMETEEGLWTRGETGLATTKPVRLKRPATIMKIPKNFMFATVRQAGVCDWMRECIPRDQVSRVVSTVMQWRVEVLL